MQAGNMVRSSNPRVDASLHIRTTGIDEMSAAFGRLVRSHDVTLTDRHPDFVSELQYARLTRSMLSSAIVRASMDVRALPARGVCLIFGAVDRPLDIRIGGRRTLIPVGGIDVVPPNVPFELYVAAGESRSVMLEIELDFLEAIVAEELRCDVKQPLKFLDGADAHGIAEQSFIDLLSFIQGELVREAPQCRSRAYVARLEELVASALVHTRPHNYSSRLEALADVAEPRFIRRAEDFIHAHAGEPLTLGSIAAVSAVSPRTLVRGFYKYKDCSPTSYLRSVRLERCRQDLLAAVPEVTSVTEAATRWGFSNIGRFAAMYRDRFGESPVATLRRRS